MIWKCCTQYANKYGKLSSGHRTGKKVFILIPKEGNAKECSYFHRIALISHASNIMLKILQARLQQYVNQELSDKMDLDKAEEPMIKMLTSTGSQRKQENFKNTSTSALLTTLKTLTVQISTICEKFSKRWIYQTTWPASWETCMQVRKRQLELDME